MLISTIGIMQNATSHYALGSTDAEHERLIWQAERFAPFTERLFLGAGIGPCQRVLDIGSGVGDVALLAARLACREEGSAENRCRKSFQRGSR